MKGTLNKTTQVSLHLHTWLIVWFVRMSSREWRQRSTALPASRSYGSFSFLNLWCTTCISSLGPCRTALSQLFRKFRYWIPHGSVQSRNSYSSIMGIFLEQLTWNIPNLYLLGLLFYKSHYWILDRLKWSFNSFFFFFSLYNFLSLCLFCSILWEIYSTFPLALLVNVFFRLTCIWFFFIPGIFLSSCHLFLFQEYSIFSSLLRYFFLLISIIFRILFSSCFLFSLFTW